MRVCYYCGMPAETVDHVVPQSLLAMLKDLNDEQATQQLRDRHQVLTVSCCTECNNLLGDSYMPTLAERHDLLKHRLRVRYRRYLKLPRWTEDELSELDGEMQTYVRQALLAQALVRRHLAHKAPKPYR